MSCICNNKMELGTVVHNNQTFEAFLADGDCSGMVDLHFVHGGGFCKKVPWNEVLPNAEHPCYDCGSTVIGHHTALCDLAPDDAVLDLPSRPGTQHWTEAPR